MFDRDLSRVGDTSRSGVFVYHIKDLKPIVARENIRIGVICVPGDNAQEVADLFVDAGITAILNFAPVRLSYRAWSETEEHGLGDFIRESVVLHCQTCSESG